MTGIDGAVTIVTVALDVTDEASVAALAQRAPDATPVFDNAGVPFPGPLPTGDEPGRPDVDIRDELGADGSVFAARCWLTSGVDDAHAHSRSCRGTRVSGP